MVGYVRAGSNDGARAGRAARLAVEAMLDLRAAHLGTAGRRPTVDAARLDGDGLHGPRFSG